MRPALASVCVLLVAAQVGGCSLYWTQGADRFVPPVPPLCDPDVLPPSLDAVLTAAFVAAAVTAGWDAGRSPTRLQATVANSAVAAVFAASGTVGFVRMSQCAQAHEQYRRWLAAHGMAPPEEGMPGAPLADPWMNPPALPEASPQGPPDVSPEVSPEEADEQAWEAEQARRFAAERAEHAAAVEAQRQAHPLALAALRIRNEGGDSTFAVRVRMDDTEEDLQTLEPQPLAAHAEGVYPGVLQARAGVATEISLVVRTGPSETVLPLDAAVRSECTLRVVFAWDAAAGRFAAQQRWE